MMIVIATQDRENYAAHEGFTGEYYWKMKGGSEYKITNVPLNIDYAEVVEMVRSEIEDLTNDYFQTQIIGWSVESDDYLSWFEKSQLEYDGEIMSKEPEIDYKELNESFA
jgi:hypothetical protein